MVAGTTVTTQDLAKMVQMVESLQKERNDARCRDWLDTTSGRSTVIAAQHVKVQRTRVADENGN